MQKPVIFMLTNEKTYSRYPVTAEEETSFETVWDSQKCWFSEGSVVTISSADGRSQTFRK